MGEYDEFDIRALDRAFDLLEQDIDDGLRQAMLLAEQRTVQTVVATHRWQNRTGTLERSTEALRPIGRALAGTLQGGVVMAAPYASYLEGHPQFGPGIGGGQWQSLNPAWRMIEPYWERDSQAALDRAVERAGLT